MSAHECIRILHLSDIHFKQDKAWDADPVLRALCGFIEREVAEGLVPDLVAITGDIAFAGIAEEYALARKWLDTLWPKLNNLPRDRLLLVPGNHDVDRGKVGRMAKLSQSDLLEKKSQDEIAKVLGDEEECNVLLRRHEAYLDFVGGWLGQPHDLPWWQKVIEIRGTRLHFAGLDSAWMACKEKERGDLLLGRYQLTQSVETAEAEGAHWRIALVHHPWDYLAEFDSYAARPLIYQRCDLLLRGHLHFPQTERILPPDPSRSCLELAAGCAYNGSRYPNAFQWIELSPTGKHVCVHFRAWRHNAWDVDRTEPGCPEGHAVFDLDPQPTPPNGNGIDYLETMRRFAVWLIAERSHWGRYHGAVEAERTVANTAEGLFLYLAPPQLRSEIGIDDRIETRREACDFLLSHISDGGLPSVSLGEPTLQCTSLGLYVLSELTLRSRYRPSQPDDFNARLRTLQTALISNAGTHGWGTLINRQYVNEREIRIPFTFWALRAINSRLRNKGTRPRPVRECIEQVLPRLLDRVGQRQFGYSFQDHQPRIVSEALYLILLQELRERELRERMIRLTDQSNWPIKRRLQFLLAGLRDRSYVELEEYRAGERQYHWWHMSFGYAVQCLALYYDLFTSDEKNTLDCAVRRLLTELVHNHQRSSYVLVSDMNEESSNSSTFPTAYAFMGLSEYMSRISRNDHRQPH
ncbi:MAG: hypothetical protein EA405_14170 [Rhodospirillales bacterium]|nr:MAG: hypothetical protein EA405_14170 [Rhodospirillales bacterium]